MDWRNIVDAVDLDEYVRPNTVYRAAAEYIRRFKLTEPFRKNVWPKPLIVCAHSQIIFISAENLKELWGEEFPLDEIIREADLSKEDIRRRILGTSKEKRLVNFQDGFEEIPLLA